LTWQSEEARKLIEVGVHNDSAIALTYGTGHHAAPGIYQHDKRWRVLGRDDKRPGSTWTRSRIQFESVVDCYARPQHTLSIFENATGRKSGTGPNVKK